MLWLPSVVRRATERRPCRWKFWTKPATVRDIASALDRADILLAEMAAWVNPFRPLGVIPGHGILDYATFLRRAEGLGPDLPLILEHLQTETNFDEAAAHIKRVCTAAGVSL